MGCLTFNLNNKKVEFSDIDLKTVRLMVSEETTLTPITQA